jgi:hypothetical protein
MKNFIYFHIIVPQGEPENPKKEKFFEQFLKSLHQVGKGKFLSLEIAGFESYAYFYIVTEEILSDTVEGLLYSVYPDCEIIRSNSEYIYNSENMAMCTLYPTRKDIYPFLNYDDFEEDSMSSMLSVISKTAGQDGIYVQILVTPQNDNWWYHFSHNWAIKFNRINQFFRIKDRVRSQSRSEIHQQEMEGILAKNGRNPFMIEVNLAYRANNTKEATIKLEALINSFYQYNKTDYNEYKIGKTLIGINVYNKITKRNQSKKILVSDKELATIYHFPNPDHTPHIVHVQAKKAEPPQDLPKAGSDNVSAFGLTNYHNSFQPFGIYYEDRRRHLYTVGKSGSGKSKLLELLIQNDIMSGKGVGVLDPHGDLIDNILRMIPQERIDDVIYFDPGDIQYPIAFNPMENVGDEYKMQVTIGFIHIFKRLFGSNWSDRLEHVLRYTLLALLDSENTTILSIQKMLTDKNYRQKIVSRIKDSVVKSFWVSEFAGWSEKFDAEAITPLLNKVGQFVSTNMIRNVIAQPKSTFNIRQIMDSKKILLMKVSKGLLGEENSSLIGSIIITKLYQAAMQRAEMKEEDRKDFYFYVDEFQNFATETFGEILEEARKYHLSITIAHQHMGQLAPYILKTVFGNVGSMISFRVGAEDARILEGEYEPRFKVRDIINLGVREFYTKISINGEIREAFSGKTLNMAFPPEDYTKNIIEQSREKYAKPISDVEKLLKRWDETSGDEFDDDRDKEFEEPII